jgi:glucosyl-dolichyl phosphate glucuronosyltransferase
MDDASVRVPEAAPARPLVSVVATTYAKERLWDVDELLESLAVQTYPNVEVVFVAERSPEIADHVTAYARQRRFDGVRVLFHEGGGGLSRARNLGVNAARGEIVAFIDDDAVARKDWAEAIVGVLTEHPSAIGVAGGAQPIWQDPSMQWFPEEFFWIISCPVPAWTGVRQVQPVRNAWGINMAFRREAFERCQFSETFGVSNRGLPKGIKLGLQGDDTDFCLRVRHATGRPILFAPASQVYHKVYRDRLTPRFTRRQAFWDGYTKATIGSLLRKAGGRGRRFALSNERVVLRQILCSFLPKAAVLLFRDPACAARRLALAIDVLLHFALGYAAARLPRPGVVLTRRYAR